MSIQDESFPYDQDLEFSNNSGKNFVFPHHKLQRHSQTLAHKEQNENHQTPVDESNCSTSSCQDDTTNSSNDLSAPAETSGKTNTSEPSDLQECDKKSELKRHNPNKAISYQDIHSEYTKRRYKHVESKVGQYIANIKALDEKRRNLGKFQRHRSLPETLEGTERNAQDLNNDFKKLKILHHSTNDLDHIHDLQSHHNTENYDNLTDTTSSLSAKDVGTDAGIFLDKQTYEQLLSDKERNEYLKSKLEEKNAENWRLKQNLDTMRIEFTICKDKLKLRSQTQQFSGSYGSAASTLSRTSLQSLLYSRETNEKATQTDTILTPPSLDKTKNETFVTPLPSDSNNNSFDHAAIGHMAPAGMKVSKSVATIQPISLNFSTIAEQDSRELNTSNINNTMGMLRQRSNSIMTRKKSTPLNNVNTSKDTSAGSSVPSSSSDSAIDIEVCESPKSQRQSRREEFVYYDQRSHHLTVLQTRNAGQSFSDGDINSPANSSGGTSNNCNGRNRRKRHNLRSRMMRFFRGCTKCEDSNMSLDPIDNSQQPSYSQIPLLEKSNQNNCRNVR